MLGRHLHPVLQRWTETTAQLLPSGGRRQQDRQPLRHRCQPRSAPWDSQEEPPCSPPSPTAIPHGIERVTVGERCFKGHFFQLSACHIRLSHCRWELERLGARGTQETALHGRDWRQPSPLTYAADVAFLTILLLPHLPSNAKRLPESTAFKE